MATRFVSIDVSQNAKIQSEQSARAWLKGTFEPKTSYHNDPENACPRT